LGWGVERRNQILPGLSWFESDVIAWQSYGATCRHEIRTDPWFSREKARELQFKAIQWVLIPIDVADDVPSEINTIRVTPRYFVSNFDTGQSELSDFVSDVERYLSF
jgi:hypothetical protein